MLALKVEIWGMVVPEARLGLSALLNCLTKWGFVSGKGFSHFVHNWTTCSHVSSAKKSLRSSYHGGDGNQACKNISVPGTDAACVLS